MEPEEPIGFAVISHGYGGCKEEQLGLSARITEANILTCTIDLRGQGENKNPLNEKTLSDMNLVIDYYKHFGKTAIVGHSLGGRLALLSDADYKIGLSPAICKTFKEETRNNLKINFKKRVVDDSVEDFLEIFYKLPMWDETTENAKTAIFYAENDMPNIKSACQALKSFNTKQIANATHSDIYILEETFFEINRTLKEWFK
jgi:pimeloyl-ACP methyl ester carboxylesterase